MGSKGPRVIAMGMKPHKRLYKIMTEAEAKYEPAAFARALEQIEDLDLAPSDPQLRFCKAALRHSLAEIRGDIEMLREVRDEYLDVLEDEAVPRHFPDLLLALVGETLQQEREAMGRARDAS